MSDKGSEGKGWTSYPKDGIMRAMYRAPLIFWRMGLGFLMRSVMVVISVRGRKSGLPRHTMLEYYVINGRVFVSSGWPGKSQWVKNIEADPHVTIESRLGKQATIAERVLDTETLTAYYPIVSKSPMWDTFREMIGFDDSLEGLLGARQDLTIYAFTPTDEDCPPGIRLDLVWVWAVAAAMVVALILLL